MPAFAGYSTSPSTTADMLTLDANTAGDRAKTRWFSWGGEATASAAMQTRVVRPSTGGSGVFTAITEEPAKPGHGTALLRIGTFATVPTLPAAPRALYLTSWNAHGGLGVLVLPPGAEWECVNGLLTGQISARNVTGTTASSYGLCWEE